MRSDPRPSEKQSPLSWGMGQIATGHYISCDSGTYSTHTRTLIQFICTPMSMYSTCTHTYTCSIDTSQSSNTKTSHGRHSEYHPLHSNPPPPPPGTSHPPHCLSRAGSLPTSGFFPRWRMMFLMCFKVSCSRECCPAAMLLRLTMVLQDNAPHTRVYSTDIYVPQGCKF